MALCWVSDVEPGLRRLRTAKGFRYVNAQGRPVRDAAVIRRIRSLAIPPAYEDVWICAREDGHLQATGRDARGRKQYRYHPDWMQSRGENKFGSLGDFAQRLPRLRRQVQRRLRAGGLDRERVVAALVRLLDRTWMRIGHREYARQNGSYGLSTLLCRHVKVSGDALLLSFVGKSGVRQQLAVRDERVAALVRRCRDLPGQELFCYEDALGEPHRIDASDVNEWLGRMGGSECSAKVFRTWHASVLALDLLVAHAAAGHAPGVALKETLQQVSARLGNTVAVCRKSYVHPEVLALAQGECFSTLPTQRWIRQPPAAPGLSVAERRLVGMLRALGRAQAQAQDQARRMSPQSAVATGPASRLKPVSAPPTQARESGRQASANRRSSPSRQALAPGQGARRPPASPPAGARPASPTS
ncbi:DNA topoisomerase-1 [Roseateles sp. YR242]|nr:DNA topoisomerase-1 [Roseateles sp. YR242]